MQVVMKLPVKQNKTKKFPLNVFNALSFQRTIFRYRAVKFFEVCQRGCFFFLSFFFAGEGGGGLHHTKPPIQVSISATCDTEV